MKARWKRHARAAVLEQLQLIGERFAIARRRRGRSQWHVALSAGLTPLTVSRIENGVCGVAFWAYLAVLKELGLGSALDAFLDPEGDVTGKILSHRYEKRPYRRKNDPPL
jgi:transcriptional regulator with XRE-family HTH domain